MESTICVLSPINLNYFPKQEFEHELKRYFKDFIISSDIGKYFHWDSVYSFITLYMRELYRDEQLEIFCKYLIQLLLEFDCHDSFLVTGIIDLYTAWICGHSTKIFPGNFPTTKILQCYILGQIGSKPACASIFACDNEYEKTVNAIRQADVQFMRVLVKYGVSSLTIRECNYELKQAENILMHFLLDADLELPGVLQEELEVDELVHEDVLDVVEDVLDVVEDVLDVVEDVLHVVEDVVDVVEEAIVGQEAEGEMDENYLRQDMDKAQRISQEYINFLSVTQSNFRRILVILRVLWAVDLKIEGLQSCSNYVECLKMHFATVTEPFVTVSEMRRFLTNFLEYLNVANVEIINSYVDGRCQNLITIFPESVKPFQPRTLKHLSRCRIRQILLLKFETLPVLVKRLSIPNILERYILEATR